MILAVEWNGDQISHINIIGLLFCLGGISLHAALKAIATSNSINGEVSLTRQQTIIITITITIIKYIEISDSSESDNEISFIAGEGQELRMPLLAEESSFSNSLVFSESDSDENSEVLFSVLKSRDKTTYELDDKLI